MNKPDKKVVKITHMPKTLLIKVNEGSGNITEKEFKVGAFLGRGGFAECYRAQEVITKKDYALKIISKTSDGMKKQLSGQRLKNEIILMNQLKHENILKLLGNCEDQHNYYILLELCSHNVIICLFETLDEMIKKREQLTEIEVKYFMRQIVKAVLHLKENQIIHRDIKTTNILLDDNLVSKIGDFGLAVLSTEQDKTLRFLSCGTTSYMAPEIINKKKYCYEIDMWSVGVVAFTLLFGKTPFHHTEKKKVLEQIKNVEYKFDLSQSKNKISDEALNFIEKIFQLDPRKRLTPEQALSESFLTINIPKYIPIECHSTKVQTSEIEKYCRNEPPYEKVDPQQTKLSKRKRQNNFSNRTLKSYFHNPTIDKHIFKEKENNNEIKIEDCIKETKNELDRLSISNNDMKHIENDITHNQNKLEKEELSSLSDSNDKPPNIQRYEIASEELNESNHANINELRNFSCHFWLTTKLKSEQYIYEFKDFSDRFGMCFMLSNGIKGIIFNDKSTIVICEELKKIVYMERQTEIKENERLMYKLVQSQNLNPLTAIDNNSNKLKIRLENQQPLPILQTANAENHKQIRNFTVSEFKSYDLPKNPNIIKKYFLLKDYCKKCSNLPQDLIMTPEELEKINLINCATTIEKYARKKKQKQYIFITKKFIQIEFKDWSKYIIMNQTGEVYIINQEYGLHKMMKLPINTKNKLPPFMLAHFNAVSKLLGYFLHKNEKK